MRLAGHLIQQERERQGLTRTDLAKLAGVGKDTVRRAETGPHEPAGSAVACIAAALEVPLDTLYEPEAEKGAAV